MNPGTILRTKAVAIAGTLAIAAGIFGGVALASTPSGADGALSAVPGVQATVAEKDKGKGDAKLKAVLDGLVDKGVITRAQADAILDAVSKAHGNGRPELRQLLGDVMKASVEYLGLPADQVKAQLASGKSLGEIANATAGKSRVELVTTLDDAAAARIKAAVNTGKIKPEQAEALRTKVNAAIEKIVDHKGGVKK
ncbi:MAG TPA: hypothetical protein VHG53_05965 [Candidatus Limnocylindria bacterium]|nr:hypothetical protein [Candidatus Limnocylindria bacterium]